MRVLSKSRHPKPPALQLGAALFLIAAFGLSGCGSAPSQPPPTQGTTHSVTLSWAASTVTVSGYAVYRSTEDPTGPFYPLTITLPGTTQYTDANVVPGQSYYYTITAFDSANLQSFPTFAVSATIPAN